MGIINFIKETGKTVITHPIQSFKTGLKEIVSPSRLPRNLIANTVPFSPAGGAVSQAPKILSKTRGFISKGYNAVKSELQIGQQKTFGQTAKNIGRLYGGAWLGKYSFTGDAAPPGTRELSAIAGITTAPTTFITGGLSASTSKAVNASGNFVNFLKDKVGQVTNKGTPYSYVGSGDYQKWMNQLYPNDIIDKVKIPTIPDTINVNVPEFPSQMIQLPTPNTGGTSLSFNPTVSGSAGGMGDILPLALLLAGGAGIAGYALGRKKKKKYKKRRKH